MNGIIAFRDQFLGKLWVEVMLVQALVSTIVLMLFFRPAAAYLAAIPIPILLIILMLELRARLPFFPLISPNYHAGNTRMTTTEKA